MPVDDTAKGDGIFKNVSKRGKREGLVVNEEKSGGSCGFFFDTEGIQE